MVKFADKRRHLVVIFHPLSEPFVALSGLGQADDSLVFLRGVSHPGAGTLEVGVPSCHVGAGRLAQREDNEKKNPTLF